MMQYLLNEEEWRALPTQHEMDELEQRIQHCDVLIAMLRDTVLKAVGLVCIHNPLAQEWRVYYCDACPLSQKKQRGQELRLCDLEQRFSI